MEYFSKRLKELREENNLTLTQLANKVNYSAMAISRWERGLQIPNIEVLITFAKFFNVSAGYLCGLED